MKKYEVVRTILGERWNTAPHYTIKSAFAPTNIALCKYWGKRDEELNLPLTSSLSISLGAKGTTTELKINSKKEDEIYLNGGLMPNESPFSQHLLEFLNLFRYENIPHFIVHTNSNVPIAAGLASSASGFASLVLALDGLFDWQLSQDELSILARLGSGSACRSIWQGFVHWHAGISSDGMDSHGESLRARWPDLCIGLLILSESEKAIPSRLAMQRTITTSALYQAWPSKVSRDLAAIKQAIGNRDFQLFGKAAESNAMTMHATMLSAWPPIVYSLPETLMAMQQIWELRAQGLQIYFTQDAGPNLKLLFLQRDIENVVTSFPNIEIIQPFAID